jgi:glycine cleavage system H protein
LNFFKEKNQMNFPPGLKYSKSHEWLSVDGDVGTCGITAWAAEQIGEVVSIDLPELGKEVKQGSAVGAVESSKASSEIYAPVSGKVVEVNTQLEEAPEKINESPFDEGWIFKIQIKSKEEIKSLLDAGAYQKLTESEPEK